MKKSAKKTVIAVMLIVAGVGFLIYKGVSETGVYYLTVGEVIAADPGSFNDRGIRVSGKVVEGSTNYNQRDLLLTFTVRDLDDDTKTMKVMYTGVVPDAFKPDVEVILEGSYDRARNTFSATTLLAKCPSKYKIEETGEKE
ncbi:cytochrome c-type biogenesis protein CcmE [bacterium BMS3Bbin07]|nr:cytochrome c-type biogenesis protein CcmE [bacterium BMS3Bbin07]HDH01567.1 cytochrome c maturation protein CcmE [Nitrospirota bacterium]